MTTSAENHTSLTDTVKIAANDPVEHNPMFGVTSSKPTLEIKGTVTAATTGDPVAGVEISVEGLRNPVDKDTKNYVLTGTDGTYAATVEAKANGGTVSVMANKDGMTFTPVSQTVTALEGSSISGINFTGFVNATITGRVARPEGGPMADVKVTATGPDDTDSEVTGPSGQFSLSVTPWGTYTIKAELENYTFDPPMDDFGNVKETVSVTPGQHINYGTIQARTFGVSNVMGMRTVDATGAVPKYDGDVKVSWTKGTQPEGHTVTHQAQTMMAGGDWTDLGNAVAHSAEMQEASGVAPKTDSAFSVRVLSISTNDTDMTADTIASDPATAAGVDPSPSGVTAARDAANADMITVSWKATTNSNSDFRIVVQFSDGIWYYGQGSPYPLGADDRQWVVDASAKMPDNESWTSVDGTRTVQAKAELAKTFNVAVEWVQGAVDEETNPWTRSTPVSVAAKPSS